MTDENKTSLANKQRFKLIAAVYLILRKDDEILLLRRANTGYQDGKYSLIAGHMDGDELASKAIIREAQEEAGIVIKKEQLKFVRLAHRLTRNDPGQERIDIFSEAENWGGVPAIMEKNKCDDLSWHSLASLPSNIVPLVGLVLDDVAHGIAYSEYETEPA